MYKYTYRGEVHTARDFFEAHNKAGLSLPLIHSAVSHYVVRLWQWDDADREFSIEILNPPGHQVFNAYDEALVCFNTLTEFFPSEIEQDLKLELVHFYQGETYDLGTQILLPPVADWQW
ncbi:MAG: hypothetical protein OEZ51_12620 [Nitrospinota bacterium]|nr:hypothetical protein [Nitrospinota bacterium]